MLDIAEPIAALLLIGALLMVSVIEAAFVAVSRVSARRLMESSTERAGALNAMLERRDETLMALAILIDTVLAANTVFLFATLVHRDFIATAAPLAFLVTFLLILTFRLLVPRLVAARNPEAVLLSLFPLFQISVAVMRPFASPLSLALKRFQRWEEEMEPKKEEETSEEEIQAFIDAGQEEGILEPEAGQMVQSIVHFGDKVAREVMTPRIQIVAIDIDAPIEELLDLIVTRNHARIPVFRGNIDDIEGIIHERDLIGSWRRGEKAPSLRPFVKPAQFIPETKPINDLLREMKQNGDQMALVVDEYGGVSGLITMEDLVEEIVGEIHDAESDTPRAVEESPGTYVVPGSLELNALDDLLGTPFVEETECTTVAGAVVELFGRLPAPGERIEHRGVRVDVLEADRRRVHRLRVKAPGPRNGGSGDSADKTTNQ